jgi:hypothetical protein
MALASGSQAAIVSGSFGGTVASGTDGAGVFGAVGGDLAGDSFSLSFSFDTNAGTVGNPFDPAAGQGIGGGAGVVGFGPSSPGSGSITINGSTVNILGQHGSLIAAGDGGGGLGNVQLYLSDVGAPWVLLGVDRSTVLPTDLNTPFAGNPCATAVACTGFFTIFGGTFGTLAPNFYSISADGVVALSPVGGVPEPASWALMITGFFGAGAALRKRSLALA